MGHASDHSEAGRGGQLPVKAFRARCARALSGLLIPLSVVPLVLVAPLIAESYRNFDRRHNSAPFPAPELRLTATQKRRFAPVAPFRGAIPVLSYHGIGAHGDGHSVTRRTFAEQMAALHHMGFRAIGIEQYVRFRRGQLGGLPDRPVLITFDDGRLDSYRAADLTLARFGFRAVMFVNTDQPGRKHPLYLTWKELHAMSDSRRWEVQPQAHEGHIRVALDARGHTGPFYAARRFTRSEGRESFAGYEQRVTSDVFAAKEAVEEQGFAPRAFAVPYGDYGQRSGNDPRIAPFMRDFLGRQFEAVFVEDERNAPGYSRPWGVAERYRVHRETTTDRLYVWLRDNSPEWLERRAKARRAQARRVKRGRADAGRAQTRRERNRSR
jgi:peptidoglycan/xylan/chitin deacetylase (PgdA/CDA1 family)